MKQPDGRQDVHYFGARTQYGPQLSLGTVSVFVGLDQEKSPCRKEELGEDSRGLNYEQYNQTVRSWPSCLLW
jgi:hypothetical protein